MKTLIKIFIILFAVNAYAATDFFPATCLTGGSSGCLDAIDVTNADIDDGEKATAKTSTEIYEYRFDADSGVAESSPWVIKPDKDVGVDYAGTGRWILVSKSGRVVVPYDATVDQGDDSIVGTLAWHITNASGAETTVTVLPGTYKITTNIVVPATMSLQIDRGGIFKPDAAKTLTVESPEHLLGSKDQQIVDLTNNSTNPLLFTDGGTVYPEWWGAYNNGSQATATGLALQASITSLASVSYGAEIRLSGAYLIDTQLSIAFSGLRITGDADYYTRIIASGCSALLINQVDNITLQNFEIGAAIRYTDTPNAYIGIDIAGVTGARPENIVIRDIYIDGFETGIESNWMWSSVLDNVTTAFGHVGILALGVSVNNVVTNSSFSMDDGASGAIGISFNDTNNSSEGWMITNTLIYGGEYGIYGLSMSHVLVQNCIIDFNYEYGIYIADGTSGPSIDWIINGNYIAMTGTATSGITILQGEVSTQTTGSKITNNKLIVYSGQTCTQGIQTAGDEAKNIIISGNSLIGFGTYDIKISDDIDNSTIITGNQCLSSGPTYNIYSGAGGLIANNVGVVYYTEDTTYVTIGKVKHVYAAAAPASGTWNRGDIAWNTTPTETGSAGSQYIVTGWICEGAGTPGTWKEMRTLTGN